MKPAGGAVAGAAVTGTGVGVALEWGAEADGAKLGAAAEPGSEPEQATSTRRATRSLRLRIQQQRGVQRVVLGTDGNPAGHNSRAVRDPLAHPPARSPAARSA